MSKLPETGPSLLRHLRQQQRQMVRQADSSAFARSGTAVTAEGVTTVDGEHIVDGSETVNGPLAVHGTAAFDGNTTIGGNLVVAGTLSLPNSIIGNDALTNPVVPGVANGLVAGFTLGASSSGEYAGIDLLVPSGCTSLLLNATARITVTGGSTIGAISIEVDLADASTPPVATGGETFTMGVGVGERITVSAGLATLATGLTPGSTLHLGTFVSSLGAIPANGTNVVALDTTLLWLR